MTRQIKNRTIFTGDNLPILRGMNSESVDLIYLDPPFNSNANYAAPVGSKAAGAEFKDTWGLSDIDEEWYGELADGHQGLYDLLTAVRQVNGTSMMSYLIYMTVRLMEMHRVLKPVGSLYLHCDSYASHYLKLLLDDIFGKDNFRNEIVWHYRTYQGKVTEYYPNKHDTIFWYAKDEKRLRDAGCFELFYSTDYEHTVDYKRWKKFYVDGNKIKYGNHPETDSRFTAYLNRWVKENGREPEDGEIIYECRGYVIDDVWTDIQAIDPKDTKEKTGYLTQKPLALLGRIIQTSSNEDDVVLDPFCGCATTCIAAEMLDRRWIGIDISPKSAELVKIRLAKDVGVRDDTTGIIGEVVERQDIPVRTDTGKQRPSRDLRHVLYGKQEGICVLCKCHFPFRNFTMDHIVPKSKGGSDTDDNLQLLCGACNSLKGDRTMAETRALYKAQFKG